MNVQMDTKSYNKRQHSKRHVTDNKHNLNIPPTCFGRAGPLSAKVYSTKWKLLTFHINPLRTKLYVWVEDPVRTAQ